jgi:DNA-binding MarR family transcriptional regulator
MALEREEHLYVLLRRAARELERLEAVALSRTRARLRPAQVPVLATLLVASPLTAGEICARCEIEPSTLTGILQTLERNGLVVREKVVRDQRAYAIQLTPRGRAAARVAQRKREEAQRTVLRSLSREAALDLPRLLVQLSDAAQSATAAAAPEATGSARRRRTKG